MAELLLTYLRARGTRRLIVPVRLPGKVARASQERAHLAPDRAVGMRTWEEYLAEQVSAQADRRLSAALATANETPNGTAVRWCR